MAQDHFRIRTLYGREYQVWSLDNQANLEPVDEAEEKRLHEQHELLLLLFTDRVNPLVPDSVRDPAHILDCGYGTGEWASAVAESFPDSQVTGIDISPVLVQRNDRPDNFIPEVADLNKSTEAFEFMTESFDFVNSRFVAAGLAQARWPSYITDIRRVLKKGGVVEFIEWDLFFRSASGNGDRLAALRQWTESYLNAIGRSQGDGKKSRQSPPPLGPILESSGFVNVSATTYEIPLGPWAITEDQREIGRRAQAVIGSMLPSLGTFPILDRGVMSEADFRNLINRCIQEMAVEETHAHIRLYVCYGEKPR